MVYLASADMVAFGENVIAPIFLTFIVIGLPIVAFVFFRVLAHRERLEMIRRGFDPQMVPGSGGRTGGRSGAERARRYAEPYASEAAQTTLRKGITLTFVGLALTIGLSFAGYHTADALPGFAPATVWEPGPWLLGGLIPMFVGLAQVVIAVLSGATLRPLVAPAPPYDREPSAAGPHSPEGATTFDGSYTYRPGDTQELRPPSAPPERRR